MSEVAELIQRKKAAQERILHEIPSILTDPKLFEIITVKELDKKIVGEIPTRQTLFLAMAGAIYVKNPSAGAYNLLPNNRSGAGKDYVGLNTLKIFPSQYWEFQTRISPKALTYWKANDKNWTWDGKILYLSDVSQDVLDSEVLKVMMSEGSKAIIATGDGKVKEFEVSGKPAIIISTANSTPNDEMLRRLPILHLDEGTEQTEAILKRQAKLLASGESTEYDRSIKNALAKLLPVEVVIPYAEKLLRVFSSRHIIMRTHFARLASYVKASAALHQHQRERDDNNRIIANGQDYDIARIAIITTTQNEFMVPISRKQQQVLDVAKDQVDYDGEPTWFSVPQVRGKLAMAPATMYEAFRALSENFFDTRVVQPEGDNGGRPKTEYRLRRTEQINIPTWEEVEKLSETTEKRELTEITEQTKEKASNKQIQVNSVNSDNSVFFAQMNKPLEPCQHGNYPDEGCLFCEQEASS